MQRKRTPALLAVRHLHDLPQVVPVPGHELAPDDARRVVLVPRDFLSGKLVSGWARVGEVRAGCSTRDLVDLMR